ncbi:MAG: hypothetical protein QOF77_495 [Solirubrobacteraceae bacterium]|jgi:hypothetical protein|nr:hypothetical protein [Solirubrobacteraceae bacterium]
MRPGRIIILIAIVACAALVAACGGDTTNNRHASNEGVYVDLGHLKYQVELSRQLNPYDGEDSSYLLGLAPADQSLGAADTWFGVFMLAVNKHDQAYPAAHGFYITDTQGITYRPTPVPGANPFAYHGTVIPPHDQLPAQGSAADNGPTQGLVLLFKVPLASFDNRPLVLHITDPSNAKSEATVELDV